MATAARSEVPIQANGKTWTLQLRTRHVAQLECDHAKPLLELCRDLLGVEDLDAAAADAQAGKGGPTSINLHLLLCLVQCALKGQHPDVTLDECGDLIDELGIAAVFAALTEAVNGWGALGKGRAAKPSGRRG